MNELFKYDAKAFGCEFLRLEKVRSVINYICDRKKVKRSQIKVDRAIEKVINKRRKVN